LIDFTIKTFNKIDVAIYAAGISMHTLFEKIKDINKVYKTVMDINFTGLVYFSYYCKEHLKKK